MVNVSLLGPTSTTQAYLVCHTDASSQSVSFAGNQWYRSSSVYVRNGALYSKNGFYQSSDSRLKNFGEDVDINFEKLANLPKKYYTWINDTDNEGVQIGTSAQELMKLYPELVSHGNNDVLTVDYARLSIVALKAIDLIYQDYKVLKNELESLKKMLNQ
jgi:hypothetical protein